MAGFFATLGAGVTDFFGGIVERWRQRRAARAQADLQTGLDLMAQAEREAAEMAAAGARTAQPARSAYPPPEEGECGDRSPFGVPCKKRKGHVAAGFDDHEGYGERWPVLQPPSAPVASAPPTAPPSVPVASAPPASAPAAPAASVPPGAAGDSGPK